MRQWRSVLVAIAVGIGLAVSGQSAFPVGAAWAQRVETQVAFNTNTLKFHGLSCRWAHKCTKNCVVIPLNDAVKRGGVPCKVCGGR